MFSARRPGVPLLVLSLVASLLVAGVAASVATAATSPGPASDSDAHPISQARALVEQQDPTATIAGLVYDDEGELLDSISVEAYLASDPTGEPVASDFTYQYSGLGNHGAYRLHVPPGHYLVRFSSDYNDYCGCGYGYDKGEYVPQWYGGGGGTPVSVSLDGTVTLGDTVMSWDPGVEVSGKVVDNFGDPVEGARTVLYVEDPGTVRYWTSDVLTNASGEYHFPNVAAGHTYTLGVRGGSIGGEQAVYLGYPDSFLGGKPAAEVATTFHPNRGDAPYRAGDLVLQPGTTVSGTLVHNDDTPVSSVCYQFYLVDGSQRLQVAVAYNDGSPFSQQLQPGFTYTVGAHDCDAFDEQDVYLGDTYQLASASTFSLGETPVTLPQLKLVPDVGVRHITGMVQVNGVPEANPYVELYGSTDPTDEDSWDSVMEASGDANGNFDVTLPSYTIDYTSHYTSFTLRARTGSGFSVYLGDTTSVVGATTFTLPPLGDTRAVGTISATVFESYVNGIVQQNGSPAGGLTVQIVGHLRNGGWDGPIGSTTTKPDGTYAFRVSNDWRDFYDQLTVEVPQTTGPPFLVTYLGDVDSVDAAEVIAIPSPGTSVQVSTIHQRVESGALLGTVSTSDAQSLGLTGDSRAQLLTQLYRWDDANSSWGYGTAYVYSRGMSYAFSNVEPGTYFVRTTVQRQDDVVNHYLSTTSNGTWQAPTGPGQPGTFTVPADADVTTGPNVALERGVIISGSVAASDGTPVTGFTPWTVLWSAGGLISGPPNDFGTNQASATYTTLVPTNADVFVQGGAPGFATYYLGNAGFPSTETDSNSIHVGTADVTRNIVLTPSWGKIGAVAGQQLTYCLANSGTPIFDGRAFVKPTTTANGALSAQTVNDYYYSPTDEGIAPFGIGDITPLLAPLYGFSDYNYSTTWGLSSDGNTLCVQYGVNGLVAQVLLTKTGNGEYDVTYNYDNVSASPAGARAGYTNGEGDDGAVLFPGGDIEDGYADSNTETGLIHKSLGSSTPGRYKFHFDGFKPRTAAPTSMTRPTVAAPNGSAPGATVTASHGTWRFGPAPATDPIYVYEWKVGGVVLQSGPSPDFILPDDLGATVSLTVWAKRAWSDVSSNTAPGFKIAHNAATNTVLPAITPSSGPAGVTFSVSTGSWSKAPTATGNLSYGYQWYVDGVKVSGATSNTFQPGNDAAGKSIYATVTANAASHIGVTVAANPRTVAALVAGTWTTQPVATSTTQVGIPIVVTPGAVSGHPANVTTVRWVVDGHVRSPDPDTAGLEYTPTTNDIGKPVAVQVTASALGYQPLTKSISLTPVLSASAASGTVDVHVVDGAEANVASAWVTVCTAAGNGCVGGPVNGTGHYLYTGTAGSSYRIAVSPTGANSAGLVGDETVATLPGNGDDLPLEVQLFTPQPPPTNVVVPGSLPGHSAPTIRPSTSQAFNVTGCATTSSPTYTIEFPSGATASGPLTAGAVNGSLATFSVTVPGWQIPTTQFTFETNVPADCAPNTPPTKVVIYVDPSGIVTDQYGRPIEGATVTLLRSGDPLGPFSAVADGDDAVMDPSVNERNPSTTDATGFFRWDVSNGWYKVKAEKQGCTPSTTPAMQVPPVQIDLLIKLDCDFGPGATPVAAGTSKVGEALTTDASIWSSLSGTVGISLQWLRNGSPIPGATGASYVLTGADANTTITVRHTLQRPTFTQPGARGGDVVFTPLQVASGGRLVSPADPPYVAPPVTVVETPRLQAPAAPVLTKSTVTLKVAAKLSKSKAGTATVTLKIVGVKYATGKITIKDGKTTVGTVTLKAKNKGKAAVKLKKITKKGKHTLVATYAGTAKVAKASSKAAKVTVK